jgi:hypothetical protein
MEVGQLIEVPVVALLPFPGFDSVWPKKRKLFLRGLLDNCIEVRYTHPVTLFDRGQVVKALMARNQDLVHACDILAAYWNGTKGGTANAVQYALGINKQVQIYNTDTIV